MQFKKTTLLGAALAIFSLPLIANASLDTWNFTDEDSSVRIQANGHCSGPIKYTKKREAADTPGHSVTSLFEAKVICGMFKKGDKCTADLYTTMDCQGDKIATATITLDDSLDTVVNSVYGDRYIVTSSGSNVYIRYVGEG